MEYVVDRIVAPDESLAQRRRLWDDVTINMTNTNVVFSPVAIMAHTGSMVAGEIACAAVLIESHAQFRSLLDFCAPVKRCCVSIRRQHL
jgi:hypothetical protein